MSEAFDPGLDDFEVDLGEIDADLPPAGVADVQVVDVRKGRSRANNPQWIWDLRVVRYLEPKSLIDFDCSVLRNIDYYTALTRQALWKVDEIMKALGIAPDQDGKHRFNPEQVRGLIMRAALKEGEFNGRKQTNIEALSVHPDGPHKEDLPEFTDMGGPDIPF